MLGSWWVGKLFLAGWWVCFSLVCLVYGVGMVSSVVNVQFVVYFVVIKRHLRNRCNGK